MKTICRPTRSIQKHLKPGKDARDPLALDGVYSIPCSWDKCTLARRSASLNTDGLSTGAVGEISACGAPSNDDYVVNFEETKILFSTLHCPTWLHQEAIEIYKHNNRLNRKEERLRLNKAWYPAFRCSRIANTYITSNSVVDTGEQWDWPSSQPIR